MKSTPIRALQRVFVGAAMVIVLGLSGCSSSGGGEQDGATTLTIIASTPPGSLDPAQAANGGTMTMFMELAYASLIEREVDGGFTSGLASEWGYVEGSDNTKYTIELREDAKFSDGTAVTAEAVAESINYFVENGTGPNAGSFAGISATADGAHSVLLTSETSNPSLTELLSAENLGGDIISPTGLADAEAMKNKTFGAGPYVYQPEESISGDHYVYTPNEHYYDPDRIHFDKVVIKVISNTDSALQAVKAGQGDIMVGDQSMAASAESAGLMVAERPSQWNGVFIFDIAGQLVEPLGDKRVRQALNYAVDREAIAKAVYGSSGEPTSQPNTPGADGYLESLDQAYPYDTDKAKKLLTEAGYGDGFSLEMVYPEYQPDNAKMMQAVASQWSEIGVEVKLTGASSLTAQGAAMYSKTIAAGSLNWGGMTQFLLVNEVFGEDAALNVWKQPVPGLEEPFEAYRTSTDEERQEAAQAVEKVLVDEAASVPVARFSSAWIANPDLEGFELNIVGGATNPADWTLTD